VNKSIQKYVTDEIIYYIGEYKINILSDLSNPKQLKGSILFFLPISFSFEKVSIHSTGPKLAVAKVTLCERQSSSNIMSKDRLN